LLDLCTLMSLGRSNSHVCGGAAHSTDSRWDQIILSPTATSWNCTQDDAKWCATGGRMLYDFSEAERNTTRRALEIYVTELRQEIVKTEKHEWRDALHLEKRILEGVIEQLSV
jgi:hypothetical protein